MADQHERRSRQRRSGEILGAAETGAPAASAPAVAAPAASGGALAFIDQARDLMTVRRVFGEPFERDGVTVIPAASVRGGGGGGSGTSEGDAGSGGGFGFTASPAGAYVIAGGDVRWEPAFDLNRTILVGQVVAIVALLTVRSVVKALAKRR